MNCRDFKEVRTLRRALRRPGEFLSGRNRRGRGGIGGPRSRPNAQPHHPAPLSYLAVSLEAELLEQVGRSCVVVGTALRVTPFDLFRVSLDQPTASLLDGDESGAEASSCNPMATVPAAGEDAADPPVRRLAQILGVGVRVPDVRKLRRRPVLAPAGTVIAVINEDLVDCAVANVGLLGIAVLGRVTRPSPRPVASGSSAVRRAPPRSGCYTRHRRPGGSGLAGSRELPTQ